MSKNVKPYKTRRNGFMCSTRSHGEFLAMISMPGYDEGCKKLKNRITIWISHDCFGEELLNDRYAKFPTFDLVSCLIGGFEDYTNNLGEMDEIAYESVKRLTATLQQFLGKYKPVDMEKKYPEGKGK